MTVLKEATAIVTGGAMGIGYCTSKRLLEHGCKVTIWDIDDKALNKARQDLKDIGPDLYCHHCDITDQQRVNDMAVQAQKDMGVVDILINNAGCVVPGRFCSKPPSAREKETYVNLISMYYTIYAFLPGMYQRNKGHIVNISSGAGLMGMTDLAVYCATKWAVYGLTESLRLEAVADKKTGVRFSSVHPGIIKHGLFEGSRLNRLGELLIPRVETHDQIAREIVDRALKRNHNVVKYPRSLHLGVVARALLPDPLMGRLMLLAGADRIMKDWTGHGQKNVK